MKEGNERKIRKMLENREIIVEDEIVKYKTKNGYKKATFGWEGLENVPPEITQIMDDEDIGLPDLEDEIRKIEKWTREPRETPKIKDLDSLDVGSEFTLQGEAKYVQRKTFTRRDGSEGSLLSFYLYDGSPRGLRVIMWDAADHPIEEGDHCTVKGKLQHNNYTGKLELCADRITTEKPLPLGGG